MGVVYQVEAKNHRYHIVDDVRAVYRVLVRGRVTDGITGDPVQAPLVVGVDHPRVQSKQAPAGLWCLAGQPEMVFPDPSVPHTLHYSIGAAGYSESAQVVTIPAHALFPISVPDLRLSRLPVQLQGRVSAEADAHNPISDAHVVLVNEFPTTPPNQLLTRYALGLGTSLRSAHAAGLNVNGYQPSAVVLGPPARTLVEEVRVGATTLMVNNRIGLAVGQALKLGPAFRAEYALIDNVISAAPAGPVELTAPLRRGFPAQTTLEAFTLGAPTALGRLADAAAVGDGLLLLNNVPAAQVPHLRERWLLEIADPAHPREYLTHGAQTGADGFYRFEGVNRLEALELSVSAAGFTSPPPLRWLIDYDQSVNTVNFRLRP
jgi:hypothetical protein